MGMSLELVRDGKVVMVEPFREGSVRPARYLAGSDEIVEVPSHDAEMTITYNYSEIVCNILPQYNSIHDVFEGRIARDVEPELQLLVDICGTQRSASYWDATPGNVGAVMNTILGWCRQHPDAIFETS